VVVIAVVLLLSLAAGGLLRALGVSVTIPESIALFDVIDTIGPLMLSLILVVLYWQLFDVQSFQARIQEKQQAIEGQQIRPYIIIEDSHHHDGEETQRVKASNFGQAPATDLSLVIISEVDSEMKTIGFRRFTRDEGGYNGWSGLGNFLRPGDKYVQFIAQYPTIDWKLFSSQEGEEVPIVLALRYADITGEEYHYLFRMATILPQDEMKLANISWDYPPRSSYS
jgi:hypothetical protein